MKRRQPQWIVGVLLLLAGVAGLVHWSSSTPSVDIEPHQESRFPTKRPVQLPEPVARALRDSSGAEKGPDDPSFGPPETLSPTGWQVDGRVINEAGDAIVGCSVKVCLRGPETVPLASTSTDVDGSFALQAVPPTDIPHTRASAMRPVVIAEQKGYESARKSLRPHKAWNQKVALELVLKRPETAKIVLRGRVVDDERRPVSDAMVWCDVDGETVTRLERTGEDGGYELESASAGSMTIKAITFDFGSGQSPPFVGSPGESRTVADIELQRGAGTIEGFVLYPDGTPAPDFGVAAIPVSEFDPLRPPKRFASAWTTWEDATDEGLDRAMTRTDERGRFFLRSLAPGRYAIFAPAAEDVAEHAQIVRTDSPPMELKVVSHRVHVSIVDEQGIPVPGASLKGKLQSGSFAAVVSSPDARHTVHVTQGNHAFAASTPGSRLTETSVEVRPQDWDVDLTLELAPARPTGTLRFLLREENGEPLTQAVVSLFSPESRGLHKGFYQVAIHDDLMLTDVPCGTIQVEIDPGKSEGPWRTTPFFREVLLVTVEPGEETLVEHTVIRGARLELTVHLPGGSSDTTPDIQSIDDFYAAALDADVRLQRPGESPENAGPFVTHLPPWSGTYLVPGLPGISESVYEPGAYRLTVAVTGSRPTERNVVLRSGETTPVTVHLEELTGD